MLAQRAETASPLHNFNDLVGGSEVQLPGQRRLQVGFQELALPAIPVLKGEVHPVPIIGVHADRYRKIRNEDCAQFLVTGKKMVPMQSNEPSM